MPYLQTLQQHNASLQSLIDTANALPEAGSGSGGGVETCTVELLSTSDSIGFHWCIAMIVEDGTVVAKNFEPSYYEDPTITIQNVRCDSLIVVYFRTIAAVSRTCTNARLVNSTGTYDIYHVTAEPNSSVNISFDLLDL